MKNFSLFFDEKQYFCKLTKIDTNSNYNTGIHVFLKGEKTPICGTIEKETADFKKEAIRLIESYNNQPNFIEL